MIRSQKGFTLIELAIALAVIGLVVIGLFQVTSSMSRQSEDRRQASELRTVTEGVQNYLAQNSIIMADSVAAHHTTGVAPYLAASSNAVSFYNGTSATPADPYSMASFFPGYNSTIGPTSNPQTDYRVFIKRLGDVNGAPNFQALILKVNTNGANAIPDSRGATIASQAGAGGGFVYSDNSNNGTNIIRGSGGAWTVAGSDFGIANPAVGSLAALVNSSALANTTNMLSRVNTGNVTANTMMADLNMGGTSTGTPASSSLGVKIDGVKQGVKFINPTLFPNVNDKCGTDQLIGSNNANSLTQTYHTNATAAGNDDLQEDPNTPTGSNPIKYNQGYKGRVVMGRTGPTAPTEPVLVYCAPDTTGTNYIWKRFDSGSAKRTWKTVSRIINPPDPAFCSGAACLTHMIHPTFSSVTYPNNSGQDLEVKMTVFTHNNRAVALYIDGNFVEQSGTATSDELFTLQGTVPNGSVYGFYGYTEANSTSPLTDYTVLELSP